MFFSNKMKMKMLVAILYLISAPSPIYSFVFASRNDNKLSLGFEFPLNLTRSTDDIDPDIIEESFMKTVRFNDCRRTVVNC